MKINSDYRDLLRSLNAAGVRYLVVGAYAVMIHTEPRYTKDLDVWVEPEATNAQALLLALAQFGTPVKELTAGDFTQPDTFYQIGMDPARIDIHTSIRGLEFTAAWERRMTVDFDGELCPMLGREDTIAAKRAAGRPQDRIDVQTLLTARKVAPQPKK
jgi:predicted nucleotidyltransferase